MIRPAATDGDGRPTPPRILVVDDDRRVRDLLEIALTAQGFTVTTASDGEEALRLALADGADLVVLDVRLPKKSGLEVCEAIRAGAEDPWIPIILVSAAAETDARLQGFARGADDYLGKPFSPKELVARIRRHLARSTEQREARRRASDAVRDLERAREEARRARLEEHRERRLREMASALSRELAGHSDLDRLARHLLTAAHACLGAGTVALLVADASGDHSACAIRGDGFGRIARMGLPGQGALALALAGLARPVTCAELEHMRETRAELAPIVAARFDLVAPIRGRGGLEGVLLIEERRNGAPWDRTDLESLVTLCETAATSLSRARGERARMDALMAALAGPGDPAADAREEALALAAGLARALTLDPGSRRLLEHGVSLGPHMVRPERRAMLGVLAAADDSGFASTLLDTLAQADDVVAGRGSASPEERVAVWIAALMRYQTARAEGAPVARALALAAAEPRLDEAVREAITRADDPTRDRAA